MGTYVIWVHMTGCITLLGDGSLAITHSVGCCRGQLWGHPFFAVLWKAHICELLWGQLQRLHWRGGSFTFLFLAYPVISHYLPCCLSSNLDKGGKINKSSFVRIQLAEWTGSCSNNLLKGMYRANCKIPGLRDKTRLCVNESDSAVPSKTTETEGDRVSSKG